MSTLRDFEFYLAWLENAGLENLATPIVACIAYALHELEPFAQFFIFIVV